MFLLFQVAKSLGLFHISEGEGSQRHILVSKHEILQDTTIEQSKIQDTTTSQDTGAAAATDTPPSSDNKSHLITSKLDKLSVAGQVSDGNSASISSHSHSNNSDKLTELKVKVQRESVQSNVDKPQPTISLDNDNISESVEPSIYEVCSMCQKEIPSANLSLHQLRCPRQQSQSSKSGNESCPTTAQSEKTTHSSSSSKKKGKKKDAKAKETKVEKVKQKTTHVQKAAEVLDKVDDDDFDGLIASITALDSKCAFR